ncbi:MAG: hypothetical protein HUU32_16870 [Calditrichaceae bacterium]|nr:hypothetical protein [Calditrichia bacterium]NUQ43064.1 hypothetical protein [Calditrichaceae bacterium]
MDVELSYRFYISSFSHFISRLAQFYQYNRHVRWGSRSRTGYLLQLFASTNCYVPYRRVTELVRLTKEITENQLGMLQLQEYEEVDIFSAARETLFLKKTADAEERSRRVVEFFELLDQKRERKKQAFLVSLARNRQAARRSQKSGKPSFFQ